MIWTSELTLQYISLTHHTSSPPHQTRYTTQVCITPSCFELDRDVTNVFNCKLFRGHIDYIDAHDDDGGLMYTVVYEDEDGDKEDLDPQECEEVVTLSVDILIRFFFFFVEINTCSPPRRNERTWNSLTNVNRHRSIGVLIRINGSTLYTYEYMMSLIFLWYA